MAGKAGSCNGFTRWLSSGTGGVLAGNDPAGQEKLTEPSTVLAGLVIFHNAPGIADAVRRLAAEGWLITAASWEPCRRTCAAGDST